MSVSVIVSISDAFSNVTRMNAYMIIDLLLKLK